MRDKRESQAALWIVPTVALVAATFSPFPYGYSMMLRVVVCVAASVIAVYAYVDNRAGFWPFAFAAIAFVFNPFIPFHLGRKIWLFVDIGAAAIFALHLVFEVMRAA